MHAFKDTAGRNWEIALTIATIKRVRCLHIDGGPIDLLRLDQGEEPLLTRLAIDVVLLCDVIYVCIQPQAKQRNVSDEDFGLTLGGDAIVHARDAFFAELVDFFRQAGRPELARVIQRQEEAIAKAMPLVLQRVDAIDIDRLLDKTLSGPTSGS